jgi:hypothetical protein
MKQYIYTLKDPISKEIRYVGKTKDSKDRFRRHMSDYSLIESWTDKNKWLLNLRNSNLEPIMEIVDEGDSNNINSLEVKWISHFRGLGLDLLNMTDGGDGFDWTGRKHKVETIEKLKLCHPKRREVIQFDLNNNIINIFNSAHDTSENTGFPRSSISRCCLGKYIQVKGYYFRFIDDYFPCSKAIGDINESLLKSKIDEFNSNKKTYLTKRQELNLRIKETRIKNGYTKSIIKYDLLGNKLEEYSSLSEACSKTGYYPNSIRYCCINKKHYTTHGYTFRYSNDPFDYIPYNKSIQVNSKRVCKYDLDGKLIHIYDSIKQAMRDNNISTESNIFSCCKRKVNLKTGKFIRVKGFTYRYFDDTNGNNIVTNLI